MGAGVVRPLKEDIGLRAECACVWQQEGGSALAPPRPAVHLLGRARAAGARKAAIS